ncbi:putative RNA methyltransferase [Psychromicrobium sp. YIM B11713]|uniref:putative RNA methyltransferase n=1 Tax=Psychromicrobium sp. YIM B11713 TaxID=3145233 RepID=UPI00374F56A7
MRRLNISATALEALLCPVCAEQLGLNETGTPGAVCASGHRFDFSRYGYLNLLSGTPSKFTPESAEMVQARSDFLSAGYFAPLAAELSSLLKRHAPAQRVDSLLIDAGVGTGYYLSLLRESFPGLSAIGLDLSPLALRQAVRNNPETLQVVWDLWRPWPLAAKTADVITVVFAPRNASEFHRVLRHDGILMVVTPLAEHLEGLPLFAGRLSQQPGKHAVLHEGLAEHFELAEESEVRLSLQLGNEAAKSLVMMGPSGHHLEEEVLQDALDAASYQVQAAFRVSVFRPFRLAAQHSVLSWSR